MPISETFLEERKTAIGGSDVLHLVGLPPWGCTRRLWYEKSGVPADFPFLGNPSTERGTALESVAIHLYERETHREVRQPPWHVSDLASFVACHADGIQKAPGREGRGLVEVKCPSGKYYYAVRSKPDPPNEAALQAQWGMLVHDLSWGTVLLFCADCWQIRYWDVVADPKMQEDLLHLARGFWPTVSDKAAEHPRLDPCDSRCKGCPWRKTCQGLDRGGEPVEAEARAADGHRLGELHDVPPARVQEAMLEYIAAKAALKDANASFGLAKSELSGLFPGPGRLECDLGSVKLSVIRKRGYTAEVPATTYEQLRVLPNQVEGDEHGDCETD